MGWLADGWIAPPRAPSRQATLARVSLEPRATDVVAANLAGVTQSTSVTRCSQSVGAGDLDRTRQSAFEAAVALLTTAGTWNSPRAGVFSDARWRGRLRGFKWSSKKGCHDVRCR
jgi:hypothetical protein